MAKRRRKPVRRSPSVEAFRVLLALHEEGSVRAAARQLKQTQSVVSRKLEVFLNSDACGAILLTRSKDALRLTGAALAALPTVRELVSRYDQLLGFLCGARTDPEIVRLAVGSFAAQHYIPRAISIVRDSGESPEIETHIVRGEKRVVGVLERRYDLAIVSHHPQLIAEIVAEHGRAKTELTIEPLADLRLAVVARRGTEEARELDKIPQRKTVPLPKLRRWNLVGLDSRSGIRRQLEKHFRRPDELHFLAEGGGWAAAKEFARYGLGVAILPLATISQEDETALVVRRLNSEFSVEYSLVYRSEALESVAESVRSAVMKATQLHRNGLTR